MASSHLRMFSRKRHFVGVDTKSEINSNSARQFVNSRMQGPSNVPFELEVVSSMFISYIDIPLVPVHFSCFG